jgi:cytochrome P450
MVCIDLFFTSSDTTSAALEFAMLYMTLNPEVARKVKHEIDTVLGGRMPNLEDREK